MGRQLSDQVRQRVVDLYQRHREVSPNDPRKGVTKIQLAIVNDGYKISRKAIYYIIQKWEEHGTLGNLESNTLRLPQDVTLDVLDFIDRCMEEDDELTAPKLKERLATEFSVTFSESKVKRLRKALGWLCSASKYCQLVKEVK